MLATTTLTVEQGSEVHEAKRQQLAQRWGELGELHCTRCSLVVIGCCQRDEERIAHNSRSSVAKGGIDLGELRRSLNARSESVRL